MSSELGTASFGHFKSRFLPNVLVIVMLIGLCMPAAYATGSESGTIRIEVLLGSENISQDCLGTALDVDSGSTIFLAPAGNVLTAQVPPGYYQVVVFYPENASLLPQMLDMADESSGESESRFYEFDENDPFFPGHHSEEMRDNATVTCSGAYRYNVTGITDYGFSKLEEVSGTVRRTGI